MIWISSVLMTRSIVSCATELKNWMTINKLQLNEEKLKKLFFSPRNKPQPNITTINVCGSVIPVTQSARHIGLILDSSLSMAKHVSNVCSVPMSYPRRIAAIRDYITQSACETLVHSLITSRIYYANAVLYGLYRVDNIQRIMNIAARIVTKTFRKEHISPVSYHLHWLPIDKQVIYKILLLTFRAYRQVGPEYLNEQIIRHVPTLTVRSLESPHQLFLRFQIYTEKWPSHSQGHAFGTHYHPTSKQHQAMDTSKPIWRRYFFENFQWMIRISLFCKVCFQWPKMFVKCRRIYSYRSGYLKSH